MSMERNDQIGLGLVIIAIAIIVAIYGIQQNGSEMCAHTCSGTCGSNWLLGSNSGGYEYSVLTGCHCLCRACDWSGCRVEKRQG
jgi:hypothetical protein